MNGDFSRFTSCRVRSRTARILRGSPLARPTNRRREDRPARCARRQGKNSVGVMSTAGQPHERVHIASARSTSPDLEPRFAVYPVLRISTARRQRADTSGNTSDSRNPSPDAALEDGAAGRAMKRDGDEAVGDVLHFPSRRGCHGIHRRTVPDVQRYRPRTARTSRRHDLACRAHAVRDLPNRIFGRGVTMRSTSRVASCRSPVLHGATSRTRRVPDRGTRARDEHVRADREVAPQSARTRARKGGRPRMEAGPDRASTHDNRATANANPREHDIRERAYVFVWRFAVACGGSPTSRAPEPLPNAVSVAPVRPTGRNADQHHQRECQARPADPIARGSRVTFVNQHGTPHDRSPTPPPT